MEEKIEEKKEEILDAVEVKEEEKKELRAPDVKDFEAMIEMAKNNYNKVLEDFENGILHLRNFDAVRKFKSVRRAIKKGRCSVFGDIYPKRPFKNCKTVRGSITWMKRRLYEQSTHKNSKKC